MKKMISVLSTALVVASLATAETKIDGEKVFEAKCASCHIKMITKEETMKIFKTIKAPPMVEVSRQLKDNIKIVDDLDDEIHRSVVIAVIKDYVMYPTLEKSMCSAMMLEKNGVMPSQKGNLTEAELNAVSTWIYDYYAGKKF